MGNTTSQVRHGYLLTDTECAQPASECPALVISAHGAQGLALAWIVDDPVISTHFALHAYSNENLTLLHEGLRLLPHKPRSEDGNNPIEDVSVPNKADEATIYLKYICDHYDALPAEMYFIHGNQVGDGFKDKQAFLRELVAARSSEPHAAADAPPQTRAARTAARCVAEVTSSDAGYVALNCGVSEMRLKQVDDIALATSEAPSAFKLGVKYASAFLNATSWTSFLRRHVWDPWGLRAELGELPYELAFKCCAHFRLTRAAVRQHPAAFYRRLYHSLAYSDGLLPQKIQFDSFRRDTSLEAGVMEALWPTLFAAGAVNVGNARPSGPTPPGRARHEGGDMYSRAFRGHRPRRVGSDGWAQTDSLHRGGTSVVHVVVLAQLAAVVAMCAWCCSAPCLMVRKRKRGNGVMLV